MSSSKRPSGKKEPSAKTLAKVDEKILALVGTSKAKFESICSFITQELGVEVFYVKERIWVLLDAHKIELSSDRIYLVHPKAA